MIDLFEENSKLRKDIEQFYADSKYREDIAKRVYEENAKAMKDRLEKNKVEIQQLTKRLEQNKEREKVNVHICRQQRDKEAGREKPWAKVTKPVKDATKNTQKAQIPKEYLLAIKEIDRTMKELRLTCE
jgi:uncharacterized protein YifE (UPF0438 family)